MDFGLTHGGDAHISSLRAMFPLRATTTLVNVKGVNAIRPLINHLDKTAAIVKPIGDILLGAHATEEGQLFMPVVAGQQGPTRFETLEETLAKPKLSIVIPDTVIGFKPGNQVTHAVHIKGCNIGNAQPYLLKLKEALGGHVKVTAPKFFHGATPEPEGAFEYLGYQFALKRTTAFPNRKQALTEFDAAQFQLTDGSVVDKANWNAVVPKNPNVDTRNGQTRSKLGVTIGKRTTVNTEQHTALSRSRSGRGKSTTRRARRSRRTSRRSSPTWRRRWARTSALRRATRFPSSREGFATFIEFVSGHEWTCSVRGKSLFCFGNRVLYIIRAGGHRSRDDSDQRPHRATATPLFNFYPNAARRSRPGRQPCR